jgi:hypothetical protein
MRRILSFAAATAVLQTAAFPAPAVAAPPVTSYARASCDEAAVREFIGLSQSLDPTTEAQGQSLLTCLPLASPESPAAEMRAVVVQWLAFYRAMTNAPGGGRDVDDAVVRRQRSSGRSLDEHLRQARAGDYAGLQAAVASGDARVTQSPAARLTLARALVRKGSARSGRDSYRAYLTMRPSDGEARAEYLYSFLWDRSWDEADRQWTIAEQARATDRHYGDALRRGRLLLARFGRGGAPAATSSSTTQPAAKPVAKPAAVVTPVPSAEPRPRLTLELERLWRAKTFRRSSLAASYRGALLDVRLGAHALDLYSLEHARWRAADLVLGVHDRLDTVLEESAALGWFAVDAAGEAKGLVVGHLALTLRPWRAVPKVGMAVRAERRPLALSLPLTRNASVMPRDTVALSLAWAGFVDLRSTLGKDGQTTLWERHELVGEIPVLDASEVGRFALRLPARYEAHPRPHPEYDAPSTVSLAGVGVALATAPRPSVPLAAALTVDQLWGEVTDRRQPAKHEQLKELTWSLALTGSLRGAWTWDARAATTLPSEPESAGATAQGVSVVGSLSRDLAP